jgi:hypothetical protein
MPSQLVLLQIFCGNTLSPHLIAPMTTIWSHKNPSMTPINNLFRSNHRPQTKDDDFSFWPGQLSCIVTILYTYLFLLLYFASINTKCNQLSTFFHYLSIDRTTEQTFSILCVCVTYKSKYCEQKKSNTTHTYLHKHKIYYFSLRAINNHHPLHVYVWIPRRYTTSRHLILWLVFHKKPGKRREQVLYSCTINHIV